MYENEILELFLARSGEAEAVRDAVNIPDNMLFVLNLGPPPSYFFGIDKGGKPKIDWYAWFGCRDVLTGAPCPSK